MIIPVLRGNEGRGYDKSCQVLPFPQPNRHINPKLSPECMPFRASPWGCMHQDGRAILVYEVDRVGDEVET